MQIVDSIFDLPNNMRSLDMPGHDTPAFPAMTNRVRCDSTPSLVTLDAFVTLPPQLRPIKSLHPESKEASMKLLIDR